MGKPSRPEFLNILDSNPKRALKEFYDYAYHLLMSPPVSVLHPFDDSEKMDIFQDLIYKCAREDFRILRTYREDKNFPAWLITIFYRDVFRRLRRSNREFAFAIMAPKDSENSYEETVVAQNNPADEYLDWKKLSRTVYTYMKELTLLCRLLLSMSAEGYKPREIALAVVLPPDKDNKWVSDTIRECRRKLKNLLFEKGIDVEKLMVKFKKNKKI